MIWPKKKSTFQLWKKKPGRKMHGIELFPVLAWYKNNDYDGRICYTWIRKFNRSIHIDKLKARLKN